MEFIRNLKIYLSFKFIKLKMELKQHQMVLMLIIEGLECNVPLIPVAFV
jgi:hypothetical protein